jgi:hypothetical protein
VFHERDVMSHYMRFCVHFLPVIAVTMYVLGLVCVKSDV